MNKLTAKARITEVDGLSDSVIRIFGADTKAQEDTFLKGQIAELTTLSDAITAAILQDKAVSNLDEADSRRDEAVRNLGALLSGYAVFPLEEKKVAALGLKTVYDKYAKSGILSANYVSESSMIESMLGDFAAAEAKANIEKLDGIAEMVSAIRTAQDNFTATNDAFVKAEGSKGASASRTFAWTSHFLIFHYEPGKLYFRFFMTSKRTFFEVSFRFSISLIIGKYIKKSLSF